MTNAPIEPTEPVAANTGNPANTEYTGNPVYAPNPAGAGPAGAGSPPPKPPRRGGLPGWAWALIGGGALLLIAIIVVIVIVVNSVLGAVTASSRTDDSTAVPAPVATETAPADDSAGASATPTTKPTEAAGSGAGTVTGLDVQADLGAPFWSFPILDGWEIGVFDQEGVNQATNAELGCLFTTSQNRQSPVNADATDDRTDTVETLEFLTQQMVNSVDEAEVVGELGSTEVAIGMRDSAEALEFATSRVEYINPDDGGPYVNEIAMRAMPLSEAYLYLVVSCPAEVVDAGNSPFEEMLGEAAVIFE